ncbi:Xaa-Pro dipeptidase [Rhodothalassium salexigens]|uniref:metal-dependent hydrolase family protein n=1 Tax=Rhodothalassium salexigens TaxID=1086 RepID=UPI001913050A|nr:amidohydrolase family protein [Rhodothalassium salexigens]MBK5921708.1 Xaa-Pro dipeptidase [Rhodothalassium salexigens]
MPLRHLAAGLALLCAGLGTTPAADAQTAGTTPTAGTTQDPGTIIHAGRLLAVPGAGVAEERSILIRNGRIVAIEDGYTTGGGDWRGARIVDLTDHFVLPGLIDAHVHITGELGPRQKLDRVEMSDARTAMRAWAYADRTLAAGFTTIRDVGANAEAVFALRDAIAAGEVTGPRILSAGSTISATGGHGDVHGYRDDILHLMEDTSSCDGADDCRRAVRRQIKRGSDLIKITATGGVLSETAAGTGQQMFDDEMTAVVETAHSLGRKVAAHAHDAAGIKAALRAGVDSIEHGTFVDDEAIALFKETGAYLVPTVLAGVTVSEMAQAPGSFMAPPVAEKAIRVGPALMKMLARAHEAGVRIAFGTDTGVSPHGQNARELVLMVEAGIPAEAVLRSATVEAATLLGLDATVGTIEPGKAADIVAVAGDPLSDMTAMRSVAFVMRDGRVHRR